MTPTQQLRHIRIWIVVFMAGLLLSGITALPLQTELKGLITILGTQSLKAASDSLDLYPWIELVYRGVSDTNARYPFLAYGTDWLAFGHFVIAAAFIGPYRDLVRNKWVNHVWFDRLCVGYPACFDCGLRAADPAVVAGHRLQLRRIWRLAALFCKRLIRVIEDLQRGDPAICQGQ